MFPLVVAVIGVLVVIWVARLYLARRQHHVTVLVLGDVGRSPRMQYHALSLADHGISVSLVGYEGSKPHDVVQNHRNITQVFVSKFPFSCPHKALFLLYAPAKVIFQVVQLFSLLLVRIPAPRQILIQNPPAIPTLFVAKLSSLLLGATLVIDWHNFGYTILGLSFGAKHLIVRLSYWYERVFGRLGDAHLCVTRAMKKHLAKVWSVNATVLYDRPPEFFRRLAVAEQHQLFCKLRDEGCFDAVKYSAASEGTDATPFTCIKNGVAVQRSDSFALLVSSTSWTEDEDFSILLDAIVRLEKSSKDLPNMVFMITGKGPQKQYYEEKISAMKLKRSTVVTAWLEAEDYPRLLGSADVGVSLHTSSSGLDLPMKVVDMFGCGLPVCAVGFPCLDELVQHSKNGYVFSTSVQLSSQIEAMLQGYPSQKNMLPDMRKAIEAFQKLRWKECWDTNAYPKFKSDQ